MKFARTLQKPGQANGFWGCSPAEPRAGFVIAFPFTLLMVCWGSSQVWGCSSHPRHADQPSYVASIWAKHHIMLAWSLALKIRMRTSLKHKYLCGERPVLETSWSDKNTHLPLFDSHGEGMWSGPALCWSMLESSVKCKCSCFCLCPDQRRFPLQFSHLENLQWFKFWTLPSPKVARYLLIKICHGGSGQHTDGEIKCMTNILYIWHIGLDKYFQLDLKWKI